MPATRRQQPIRITGAMDVLILVGLYTTSSLVGLALTILAVFDPDRVSSPLADPQPSPGPASSISPAAASLTTGPAAATSCATPSAYAEKLLANIAAS
jgi:hypothetical protein